jgi:hypothetical protein
MKNIANACVMRFCFLLGRALYLMIVGTAWIVTLRTHVNLVYYQIVLLTTYLGIRSIPVNYPSRQQLRHVFLDSFRFFGILIISDIVFIGVNMFAKGGKPFQVSDDWNTSRFTDSWIGVAICTACTLYVCTFLRCRQNWHTQPFKFWGRSDENGVIGKR